MGTKAKSFKITRVPDVGVGTRGIADGAGLIVGASPWQGSRSAMRVKAEQGVATASAKPAFQGDLYTPANRFKSSSNRVLLHARHSLNSHIGGGPLKFCSLSADTQAREQTAALVAAK